MIQCRNTRDEGRKRLVAEETALSNMRVEEVELARRISDDHVVADARGMHVSEIFPNIHLGHIIVVINEVAVEDMPYEEVLKVIKKFRSPHKVAFKRYDYRQDPITDQWLSLEELRERVRPIVLHPNITKLHFHLMCHIRATQTAFELAFLLVMLFFHMILAFIQNNWRGVPI